MEKREHSCPVGENVHWCIYEEQYGGFLKKENQKKIFSVLLQLLWRKTTILSPIPTIATRADTHTHTHTHPLELIHWVEVLWSSSYGQIRITEKDNSFIYSALIAHWLYSKYYVKHIMYKDKWDMNSDFQMFTIDLRSKISKQMITMKYRKCRDGKKPRIYRNMGEICPAKPEESGAGLLDIVTLSSCLEDRY